MKTYVPYEEQYMTIAKQIIEEGSKERNKRTNVDTIRLPHAIITVDLEKEPVPILKCKNVYWKTALKEILWIMQTQSNNIKDLDAHIWDAWADDDGSIGKSYGYQIGKKMKVGRIHYPSQVHYILDRLAKDSSDRRCVLDLWNVDDLDEMNLCPCCYSSIWDVVDGKLNCMLIQRSSDYLVGVPFNTTQYALLTHLFARHLGVKPGILTHCMADAHIYCYDSHIFNYAEMEFNFNLLRVVKNMPEDVYTALCDSYENMENDANVWKFARALKISDIKPTLEFHTDETDFFSIDLDQISVNDYMYMEKMTFEVAV